MPNANYVAGRNREYRSMKLLEAAGYECTRAAGSHGTWDVIGWSNTSIIFVQVKYSAPPSKAEREQMELASCPPNGQKLIHFYKKGKHAPDVIPV